MPASEVALEQRLRHVYMPLPHDSGTKHVQGCADYVDDIAEPTGTLHVAVGGSPAARGTIRTLDLSEAANAHGVIAVITAADVPAKNDISPSAGDEPVFAEKDVIFHGQPVFAVVAQTRDAARSATRPHRS
jgi:xanthine dehydrogenase large subunit